MQSTTNQTPLVKVEDLTVRFVSRDATVHAVNGIDFAVHDGEVLCILGESGSGKTVSLRALLRLLPRHARIDGSVRIAGEEVLSMPARALRDLPQSRRFSAGVAPVRFQF